MKHQIGISGNGAVRDAMTLATLALIVSLLGAGANVRAQVLDDWESGTTYIIGDWALYNDNTYECQYDHTAQLGWEPDVAPALWVRIPDSDVWTVQVAYEIGDVVSHQGASYECLQDHISQSDWPPSSESALWELIAVGEYTHRVDVYILHDVAFCVYGDPCISTTPEEDCFQFYGADDSVVAAYDRSSLRTIDPGYPVPSGSFCTRAALTETQIDRSFLELEKFQQDVREWTDGALNLKMVYHQLTEVETVGISTYGGGFYVGPYSTDDFADTALSSVSDFIIVISGTQDPVSGGYHDLPACGLTSSFENTVWGSGHSWIAGECVSNSFTVHHEWLHQVEEAVQRLSPIEDIYQGNYAPCGEGDPDTTQWFPYTHDWDKDPDYAGCGTSGLFGFEKHMLEAHWSQDHILIANHCKDGVQNYGETAVDSGGACY